MQLEHPAVGDVEVTAVLFALSDPVRLDIVRQLVAGEHRVTCQSVVPEMPKSTRSHHLRVLREAGVVRMAPEGRERLLSLRRDELDGRWPGLLGAVLDGGPSGGRAARP